MRRRLPTFLPLAVAFLFMAHAVSSAAKPPNVVIIMADDLGYGDLGCYGHPSIRTPNLDRMAADGMRFTDFYASAPVCTPSRAALLTGRLPVRSGMASDKRRVLYPNSTGGLPSSEITIAEALKGKGYATACIGKWHLGHRSEYLPTRHGFDFYYGLPYSNDMDTIPTAPRGASGRTDPKVEYWNVPLMRNEEVLERPADQHTLTRRYTDEAVRFIRDNKSKPFFLYLPHTMPHVPLFTHAEQAGKSPRGLYGDVVEEIDQSVGHILDTLRKERLDKDTLVIFTSDNGPWLSQRIVGGSAGLLREGKGSTWEGGMRVPCIAWWPGKVKAGVVNRSLVCNMDLFNTALALAGVAVPTDRPIDGKNMLPLLTGKGPGERDTFFYYRDTELYAVRKGPYKLHLLTKAGYGADPVQKHDPPLLFRLDHDPGEQYNIAAQKPEIVTELLQVLAAHQSRMQKAPSQLDAVEPGR
jgi:arylsulfatase A